MSAISPSAVFPSAISLACDLARRFEGLADGDRRRPGLQPYRDPVGYWTIGYGHLVTRDRRVPMPDLTWSEDEAVANLTTDMGLRVFAVRRLVKVPVAAGQLAALADFAFNLGLAQLRASTLLRLLNRGEAEAAAEQFPRWIHAGGRTLPGLVRRRAAERAVYLAALPSTSRAAGRENLESLALAA